MGDEEPSDALVEGMIEAMDDDSSGGIDEEEFKQILARIKRQT